jgi:hypothetical protein
MRSLSPASTIGSTFVHPDLHREIARQRHEERLAEAERRRLAKTLQRRARRLAATAPTTDYPASQPELDVALHADTT